MSTANRVIITVVVVCALMCLDVPWWLSLLGYAEAEKKAEDTII